MSSGQPSRSRCCSSAAAGLCDWIVNICIYHDIYLDVAPKRAKLAAAEAELAAANKKLAGVRAHVQALNDKMADLTNQLETATSEKNALVAKAEATQKRANLANRLLNLPRLRKTSAKITRGDGPHFSVPAGAGDVPGQPLLVTLRLRGGGLQKSTAGTAEELPAEEKPRLQVSCDFPPHTRNTAWRQYSPS